MHILKSERFVSVTLTRGKYILKERPWGSVVLHYYYLSVGAGINYHQLGGLKQHRISFSHHSGSYKFEMSSIGLIVGFSNVALLPEALGKTLLSFLDLQLNHSSMVTLPSLQGLSNRPPPHYCQGI